MTAIASPVERPIPGSMAWTSVRTFGAVLWRDVFVTWRELAPFLAQVIIQPFFMLFIFGKVLTGIGYVGFIVGPPAIGFAAQISNLRYGLLIVVACCLISALLSPSMSALEPAQPVEPPPELHF